MNDIVFITGANKGLGYETARRLIGLSRTVVLGARDARQGQEAAAALGARFVQIDVTSDDSVAAAAADIAAHEGYVDVLINNAGIAGPRKPVEELTGADAANVFGTNVFGIVRVVNAFLPLLRLSPSPRIVNVSSGMGSQALVHDAARVESQIISPLYQASKAAVTMLTTQYAKGLRDVRVNAADPGHTGTDFNDHRGAQTVAEGTDAIVQLATEGREAGTGRFIDRHGVIPW